MHGYGFRFALRIIKVKCRHCSTRLQATYPRVRLIKFIRGLASFLRKDVTLIPVHVKDNVEVGVLSVISSGIPFVAASGKLRNVRFDSNMSYLVTSGAISFTSTVVGLSGSLRLRGVLIRRTGSGVGGVCGPRRVLSQELSICASVLGSRFWYFY